MKDFNFFSPYVETKKNTRQRIEHIVIITVLALTIFVGFAAWNQYKISSLQKSIQNDQKMLESKATVEGIKEYQLVTEKIKVLSDYYATIQEANNRLNESNTISSSYLERISGCLPSSTR